MGCERCHVPGRLPRSSPTDAGDRSDADTVKTEGHTRQLGFNCVCSQRWCAGRRCDCRQSSVSQLRLSVIQAKELIVDNRARCMRSRRQRFPTVRTHDRIGKGEAGAKMANIRACTSTAIRNRREFIRDLLCAPVNIKCITAGKCVPLQQEWCGPRQTLLQMKRLRRVG